MKKNPDVSYRRQLEVAVAAATCAGELLRSEFHRKGGPRGSGEHAEADKEAEGVIQRMLTEAFPEYGYLGEELHRRGPASGSSGHVWLVDPNDGTSAFLKGYRGASVSIALLRNGQPVLGVVYAYCAPDDSGDLFTWAEGQGPLKRNGRECRREWPEKASSAVTVLVSHTADKNPVANAAVVSPMRYRAVPGIAYRLALVAAGEGDVAVSLNGPRDWDYAAGHALIRAVGGELFDSDGAPVKYQESGLSSCGGHCFGGPPRLAKLLAGKNWDEVFERPSVKAEACGLCRPVKGRTDSDAGILSRAQGCLLGQVAGDSLGGLVEFQGPAEIAGQYPDGPRFLEDGGHWGTLAGQPTDDSEMALVLARSIIRKNGYDQKEAAKAYVCWYKSGPFDMGVTTSTALSAAAAGLGLDPTEAALKSAPSGTGVAASTAPGPETGAFAKGQSPAAGADAANISSQANSARKSCAEAAMKAANGSSQANGALMRVSPLAIAGSLGAPDTLEDWARADAVLTHPHPICKEANVLFTFAVSVAIAGGHKAEEVYSKTLERAKCRDIDPVFAQVLESAGKWQTPEYCGSKMGWVLVAFQNAFYQLLNARSLEAGIIDTVKKGGDTDTNAAVAGALLGAVYGREAIPAQWRDRIFSCRPLSGLKNVKRPRPESFWPVDVCILAELLLTIGSGVPYPSAG